MMANKKRLIDANAIRQHWLENGENEYVYDTNAVLDSIDEQPTVDAYTAEQVASIIQQADKAEARNQELEKECAWLKSCLNCKIRKECPRHCGKVVHGCDHWEYGDSTVDAVEVVHGRWDVEVGMNYNKERICPVCKKHVKSNFWNYCPNCGAKMDGDN